MPIIDVRKSIAELKTYTDRMGIFLPSTLKTKFDEVVKELWGAIVDKEIGHEEKDWKLQRSAMDKLNREITPKVLDIAADIHSRLRSHGIQRE